MSPKRLSNAVGPGAVEPGPQPPGDGILHLEQSPLFEALKGLLSGEQTACSYAELGDRFGMSEAM